MQIVTKRRILLRMYPLRSSTDRIVRPGSILNPSEESVSLASTRLYRGVPSSRQGEMDEINNPFS